jgi:stage V sporulation protein S
MGEENVPAFLDDVIKISATSDPKAVGSALAKAIDVGEYPALCAVGAGAVNQAIKALAIARGYTAPRGIDIAFVPGFADVPSGHEVGKSISAIMLRPFKIRH